MANPMMSSSCIASDGLALLSQQLMACAEQQRMPDLGPPSVSAVPCMPVMATPGAPGPFGVGPTCVLAVEVMQTAASSAITVQSHGMGSSDLQKKWRRSNNTPMTSEHALAAAREDGLTLIMAPATKTGYKGVSRGGKSSKKPYQAVRGSHSLGYYSTAEEVTLTNPTPTPNPNPAPIPYPYPYLAPTPAPNPRP